jgi:hypothetical protein
MRAWNNYLSPLSLFPPLNFFLLFGFITLDYLYVLLAFRFSYISKRFFFHFDDINGILLNILILQ